MADQYICIDHAGGWWQLRRSFDANSQPSGFVLVVKRKDQKVAEFRGMVEGPLIQEAVRFCVGSAPPKRRKKVSR